MGCGSVVADSNGDGDGVPHLSSNVEGPFDPTTSEKILSVHLVGLICSIQWADRGVEFFNLTGFGQSVERLL